MGGLTGLILIWHISVSSYVATSGLVEGAAAHTFTFEITSRKLACTNQRDEPIDCTATVGVGHVLCKKRSESSDSSDYESIPSTPAHPLAGNVYILFLVEHGMIFAV